MIGGQQDLPEHASKEGERHERSIWNTIVAGVNDLGSSHCGTSANAGRLSPQEAFYGRRPPIAVATILPAGILQPSSAAKD